MPGPTDCQSVRKIAGETQTGQTNMRSGSSMRNYRITGRDNERDLLFFNR